MRPEPLYRLLADNDIDYDACDHPPVFTCDKAERLVPEMEGTATVQDLKEG